MRFEGFSIVWFRHLFLVEGEVLVSSFPVNEIARLLLSRSTFNLRRLREFHYKLKIGGVVWNFEYISLKVIYAVVTLATNVEAENSTFIALLAIVVYPLNILFEKKVQYIILPLKRLRIYYIFANWDLSRKE